MRAPAVAVATIVGSVLLAGCGGGRGPSGPAPNAPVARASSAGGARPLVLPLPKGTPAVNGFLSSTRLELAEIAGSSNCPSVPKKLIVEGFHAIRIDLVVGSWGRTASGSRVQVPHRPRICLTDLTDAAVVIAIDPTQVNVHHELKVSLY